MQYLSGSVTSPRCDFFSFSSSPETFCARLATPCNFTPKNMSRSLCSRHCVAAPPREPHQCLGSCQGSCRSRRRRGWRYSICLLYLRNTCRRLTLGAFSKDPRSPRLGAGRRVPGPPETMVAGGVLAVDMHCTRCPHEAIVPLWDGARARSGLCAGQCSQDVAYNKTCRCTRA